MRRSRGPLLCPCPGPTETSVRKQTAMTFDPDTLIKQLSTLTVGELVELKKALESTWGVSALPVEPSPTIVKPPPPPPPPMEYAVVLKHGGANKINVIRLVRELTGLGLVAARDFVDGA